MTVPPIVAPQTALPGIMRDATLAEPSLAVTRATGLALIAAGFHVVLAPPGEKAPWQDFRPAAMRAVDDTAAREQRRLAGNRRWETSRSDGGAALATADPARFEAYVAEAARLYPGQAPNLLVHCGRSRVVWIDADTSAESRGLAADFAAHGDTARIAGALKLATPGKRDDAGQWLHRDGGHVPMLLPAGVEPWGEYTAPSGWAAYCGDRGMMVAPSVRAEGRYMVAAMGDLPEAPAWLIAAATARPDPAARGDLHAYGDDPAISAWSDEITWDEILDEMGWEYVDGRYASCGCPLVIRPGSSSRHSGVVHDETCDATGGRPGTLHIYSSGVPGATLRTWTKLRAITYALSGSDDDGAYEEMKNELLTPEHLAERDTGGLTPEYLASLRWSAATEEAPAPEAETETEAPQDPLAVLDALPIVAQGPCGQVRAILPPAAEPRFPGEEEVWAEVANDPHDTLLAPLGHPASPSLTRSVFDFSDVTRTLYHAAEDSDLPISPFNLLVRELLRRVLRVPMQVRPGLGGQWAVYAIYLAATGTGKSNAESGVASPWPVLPPGGYGAQAAPHIDPEPRVTGSLGSGQVLAELLTEEFDAEEEALAAAGAAKPAAAGAASAPKFGPLPQKKASSSSSRSRSSGPRRMRRHPVVLLREDEVTALIKKASGGQSTHIPALLSAWSGVADRSFTKKDGGMDAAAVAGPFTVCFEGGLQPKNASGFLDYTGDGLRARVVMSSVEDLYDLVESARGLGIPRPSAPVPAMDTWPTALLDAGCASMELTVPPASRAALRQNRRIAKAGRRGDFEKESHAWQVQYRLACAGALLHGTLDVTDDLWEWSGLLMEHSRRTYAMAEVGASAARQVANAEAGADRAAQDTAKADALATAAEEYAERVLARVDAAGDAGITASALRQALANSTRTARSRHERAVQQMVKAGLLREEQSGRGVRYRRTTTTTPSN